MHGAYLVCGQSLTEKIYRRHLPAENPFLVQFRRRPNVAFVENLKNIEYA